MSLRDRLRTAARLFFVFFRIGAFTFGGFFGALGATVGVALPSFAVMLLVSLCLRRFMQSRIVSYAFFGIRAGVLALIVRAVLTMYRSAPHNVFGWCVIVCAFLWTAVLRLSTVPLIALCALAGFLYCVAEAKKC